MVAFILAIICLTAAVQANPLSKITITSNSATCKKDLFDPSLFTIRYTDNVNVLLADQTNVHAQSLKITLASNLLNKDATTTQTGTPSNPLEQFKEIVLEEGVTLNANNRTARAESVHIDPKQKRCILRGNVLLEQRKQEPKDIPIITRGNELIVDLEKEEISLMGTNEKPVETIIEIAGYPTLLKKIKTKEEKRAERRTRVKAHREERKLALMQRKQNSKQLKTYA